MGTESQLEFYHKHEVVGHPGDLDYYLVLFLYVSYKFPFFSFKGLSTILLVKYLSLKVTYAKIFVRYEIFVTVYFVTFNLANILNISC